MNRKSSKCGEKTMMLDCGITSLIEQTFMGQLMVFITSNDDWISGGQHFEIIYAAFLMKN
jgi:hypothetical protein